MLAIALIVVLLVGVGLGAWLVLQTERDTATDAVPPSQDVVEAALARERERIYADLHDDLGARLLQLVYQAPTPELAGLARAALGDLRGVVSRSRGAAGSLLEVLSEMQIEAHARLDAASIELTWRQEGFDDEALDAAQALQLFRIVREAINNVIRHAGASAISVRVVRHASALRLELTDDGGGIASDAAPGRGTENMRARAADLRGDITWRGATAGGTRVILSLPLGARV